MLKNKSLTNKILFNTTLLEQIPEYLLMKAPDSANKIGAKISFVYTREKLDTIQLLKMKYESVSFFDVMCQVVIFGL